MGQLAEQLLGYMRDIMAVSVGGGPELLLQASAADYPAIADAAKRWGVETILAAVQILDQTLARMRQSVHVRTLAEMALVRMARLEDLDTLPELIAQLRGSGPTPQAARPASCPEPLPSEQAPSEQAPRQRQKKKVSPT